MAFGLRTKLETTTTIICATAVLYNIGLQYNENELLDDIDVLEDIPQLQGNVDVDADAGGLAYRRAFIATHF